MQMDPNEIRALLGATPNIQENASIIAALTDLLEASQIIKQPFTYNAVFASAGAANALAAGATGQTTVNISADAPFMIVNQTYDANNANGARTSGTYVVPNATVLLTDTGSSRQMMDVAVPVPSIFGNGQFPYILPVPKLMQANSQLQVVVTNNDAAQGMNLRLSFNGFKLYKVG